MSLYPTNVHRCQHLKVNGTQCGSPALLNQRFCHFHERWRQEHSASDPGEPHSGVDITLPVLEDANAIQVALMQVLKLLVNGQIAHRTAGLMLYALQTASSNLARTSFEPAKHTSVVIDRQGVAETPLGATQWSASGQGHDPEEEEEDESGAGSDSLAVALMKGIGLSPSFLPDGRNVHPHEDTSQTPVEHQGG